MCVKDVEGVLFAVRVRCVYWGDFVDIPTYWIMKCMCFQAVKGVTIAGTALSLDSFTHVSFMASCRHHCHQHPMKW